ncbi:hypothetical protein QFC22_003555 [Naganishia vaughanmartiniae]|uniref:Uncharacterized protein n=1 Tax=Naganishia vaughanmartiniae TaxID=1424756 RepID=A0ACC2X4W7_9TREE|nr:hypothetical protein QFC22_003555 [Naganishia vaughanmartiniae]
MKPRNGISSDDVRKMWKYAVETDFHAFNAVDTATENKLTLEYATAHRFIPFHHPLQESWSITASINAPRNLLAIADKCNVDVYNLDTGERRVLSGHSSKVSTLGFSPSDPDLLVSSSEGAMMAREEANGRDRYQIIIWNLSNLPEGLDNESLDIDGVTAAGLRAVNEELGATLTLTNEEEHEIRTALHKLIERFEAYHKVPASSRLNGRINTSFQSPMFSNSGKHLIYLPGSRPHSNGDDTWDIALYSLQDGTSTSLSGHRDAIMWIGFSPDDSLVASAGWDGTFRVHTVTGQEVWKWETDRQNWTGVFSPDGRYFAGTDGAGIIRVWDLKTGLETAKDDFGPGWCRMMDWSPNGRYLAVGGEEYGRIGLYAVTEGKLDRVQQRKLSLDKCLLDDIDMPTRRMMGHFLSVCSVKFLRSDSVGQHGTLLAHSTLLDQGVEVFDFDTGRGWRFVPSCDEHDTSPPDAPQDRRAASTSWIWNERTRDFGVISADGVRFWQL